MGVMISEEPVTLATDDGVRLRARLALPAGAGAGLVLCHPHPLYGGDMDDAVVTCVAGLAARHGVATLRFNFRGVGGSTGAWDEGRGEQRDVRSAVDALRARLGTGARLGLAGYSFGAAMAATAARALGVDHLLLVAPPLAAGAGWPAPPAGTVVIVGAGDPYCPSDALDRLRESAPGLRVEVLPGVDHFFAGALPRLAAAAEGWVGALQARQPGGRRGAG